MLELLKIHQNFQQKRFYEASFYQQSIVRILFDTAAKVSVCGVKQAKQWGLLDRLQPSQVKIHFYNSQPISVKGTFKWSWMTHDIQSAQISQKQDEHNIYDIMKTMCPPGYHHNGFVATHALVVITGRVHSFHDNIMNMTYTTKKWEILRKINYIQRNLDDKRPSRH